MLRELAPRHAMTGGPLYAGELPFLEALEGAPAARELWIRHHQSGQDRLIRLCSTPLLVGGEVAGVITQGSDLTEQRVAEAAERKRTDLEQNLIGIVSHDLRNPLQAIRLAATLGLRTAGQDARVVRSFERILASSDRGVRMIEDLLDLTRIRQGGGLTVELRRTDLHALSAQVVEEVLQSWPERRVALQTSGEVVGLWDADRIAQVVQNLVSNALQHTTEGTPVEVTTRGEGEHVVLEVHNGGPPIPVEDQPRLFECFWRGRVAHTGGGRGVGLGLFITAHIVQSHGGTVSVRSNEAEGTSFIVRLPRGPLPPSERGARR
jgi:signal transduction histidine kinase